MKVNIRLIYLYLFSFVGLLIFVIGCVQLVDLGLKVIVFKNADIYTYQSKPVYSPETGDKRTKEQIDREFAEQQRIQEIESVKNRQRSVSGALAMMLIGAPLYGYHWRVIQKENNSNKKSRK